MKFEFMKNNRRRFELGIMAFELGIMAKVFNVRMKAYWVWQKRGQSKRKQTDQQLTEQIIAIHAKSKATYGSPRMKHELHEAHGKCVSRTRINRFMRTAGLKTEYNKKFVTTTKSQHSHSVADNVLNREFHAQKPNQKWVSDITYLPITKGWLYLAVILDLFSRRVVGWAFSTSLETQVVLDALPMAQQQRQPQASDGLVHHWDRGVQYASDAFR
jgi:putative transposase